MIVRRSISHALLAALSVKAMTPRELRAHGRLFGNQHAVIVTLHRLVRRGLIDDRIKLTEKGRAQLEGLKQ